MPIYAKVNASMPWHDKIARLSDGQFRAFVKAICAAKQRESHEFNERSLRESLGEHSRHLKALVDAGLIDRYDVAVGSLPPRYKAVDRVLYTIHDYEEHQSSDRYDPTAVRRNREYRARMKAEGRSSTRDIDDGDNGKRDVSVTSRAHGARAEQSRAVQKNGRTEETIVPSREPSDDVPDEAITIDRDHPYVVYNRVTGWIASPKQEAVIDALVRDHGREHVVRAFRAVGRPDRTRDFFGEVNAWLQAFIIARNERRTRAQAEADARAIDEQMQAEDRLRQADPDAERKAEERRAAIAAFSEGLRSPAQRQQEGTPT